MWSGKQEIEVNVSATILLQRKQELDVTQTEADKAPKNQARKAFATSKGKFTYPSLTATILMSNTDLDRFLDCLSRYLYNILKRIYVDEDAKLLLTV
ncbi:hypothetical protein Tco_0955156, partial [Tanacetum coccineum]